jgi:hypothetical protein
MGHKISKQSQFAEEVIMNAMNALAKPTFVPVCSMCGSAPAERDFAAFSNDSRCDGGHYAKQHAVRNGTESDATDGYCSACGQRVTAFMADQYAPRDGEPAITEIILRALTRDMPCDLDALAEVCPPYTWNQIFLEVDRLSRVGAVQLTTSTRGRYAVTLGKSLLAKEAMGSFVQEDKNFSAGAAGSAAA